MGTSRDILHEEIYDLKEALSDAVEHITLLIEAASCYEEDAKPYRDFINKALELIGER